MYGTVAHLRVKAGEQQSVVDLMDEWNREQRSKAPGARGGGLYRLDNDPGLMILVAMFDDRESYQANAKDPEQDRWYRRLREHLTEDPAWEDGEIVAAF